MARALKGSIPRTYRDHRRKEAKTYSEAIMDLLEPWNGKPPKGSKTLLREYGRTAQELDTLNQERDKAKAGRRTTDARRLRREARNLRFMLLNLRKQIKEKAESMRVADPTSPLLIDDEHDG